MVVFGVVFFLNLDRPRKKSADGAADAARIASVFACAQAQSVGNPLPRARTFGARCRPGALFGRAWANEGALETRPKPFSSAPPQNKTLKSRRLFFFLWKKRKSPRGRPMTFRLSVASFLKDLKKKRTNIFPSLFSLSVVFCLRPTTATALADNVLVVIIVIVIVVIAVIIDVNVRRRRQQRRPAHWPHSRPVRPVHQRRSCR